MNRFLAAQSCAAILAITVVAPAANASVYRLLVPRADGNSQNGAIRLYDGRTGASQGELVRPGEELDMPNGTAIGPDGQLYVSNHGGGVLKHHLATGQFLGTFVPAGSGGLGSPSDIAFGPDRNLYVPSNNGKVLRFDGSTGAFIDVFATGLSLPQDLVFGPNGDLYVSSAFNDRINRYDGTSGALLQSIGAPALDGPHGLAIGKDKRLYVASAFTDSILRFDLEGTFVDEFVAPGSGGLRTPIDLTFGRDGDLFVNSRIEGPFLTRGVVLRYDRKSGAFIETFTDDPVEMGVPRGGMMFVNILPQPMSAVPEPATILLLLCCILVACWMRARFPRAVNRE